MSDRELLELAAKAAGVDGEWNDAWSTFIARSCGMRGTGPWTPLTNDGDALRLAVKLRLEVDIHHTGIAVRTPNGIKSLIDAADQPDPYAATRRAIVRAAAEIGRTL